MSVFDQGDDALGASAEWSEETIVAWDQGASTPGRHAGVVMRIRRLDCR